MRIAKTVDGGFQDLLRRLTPSETETENAKAHRASVLGCLKELGVVQFFRSGSFGHGTSVRDHSDVDYFAVLDGWRRVSSATTLEDLRAFLDSRFPRTGVHVDAPAVVLPLGTEREETTEIVPAHASDAFRPERPVYDIPDRRGGWMRASPIVQRELVLREDERLQGKVRPLIRFLKAWKCYNDVPIRSFYLEMYAAAHAATRSHIAYAADLDAVLGKLDEEGLPAFEDPTGVSGAIVPCEAGARPQALGKLREARTQVTRAREAEAKEDVEGAFARWDRVFAGRFAHG